MAGRAAGCQDYRGREQIDNLEGIGKKVVAVRGWSHSHTAACLIYS